MILEVILEVFLSFIDACRVLSKYLDFVLRLVKGVENYGEMLGSDFGCRKLLGVGVVAIGSRTEDRIR